MTPKPLEQMNMHTYTVLRGESVQSVSEKFGVPKAALLRENPAPFYEGQQVTVPVSVLHVAPTPAGLLSRYYQTPLSSIYERSHRVNIVF